MKKVLFPLPCTDFDPTEAAIPWLLLKEKGIEITFATPEAKECEADPIMVTGKGLGLLKIELMADAYGRLAYEKMIDSEEFKNPISWECIDPEDFDAIHLTGGHAKGMREYLESKKLKEVVSDFFKLDKVVGAICHGVVLVSRSINKSTGESVLSNRKTTCLPAWMENFAWISTKLWMGDYYRTYRDTTVQKEVKASLGTQGKFFIGPLHSRRDNLTSLKDGFCVIDGKYISARWPGDAHTYSLGLIQLLES